MLGSPSVDVFGPRIGGVCGRGCYLTSISAVHDTLPFTLGEMAQHIIIRSEREAWYVENHQPLRPQSLPQGLGPFINGLAHGI